MKYMKIIILVIGVISVTGCGVVERMFAGVVGGGASTCFRGVMYVQFTSGASVAYNLDGSVKACD